VSWASWNWQKCPEIVLKFSKNWVLKFDFLLLGALILDTFLHPIIVFFATHAHTIATCFAVVLTLCYLISPNPLLGIVSCSFTPHIYLTILISAGWSATSFSFLMGQVSLPCNILLLTQPVYNLPLTFNDISLLVSNGTDCLNLFHPIRILFSTTASTSPFTFNMSPK